MLEMLEYTHVAALVRDVCFTVPTFDFYFRVVLPRTRKEREITKRDCLGRIITSKIPDQSKMCL